MSRSGRDRFALAIAPSPGQRRGWTAQMINFLTGIAARETLLYRGGVVSSFFATAYSLSYSYRTPSRGVLASLRGRRDGRHMMGSEGEAEQSEKRPAEAEPRFPANSPRPSSPRGALLRRSGTRASELCRCGISLLAPAEFRPVHPHAVHDHGEASRQGDDRLLGAAPTRHLHAPAL